LASLYGSKKLDFFLESLACEDRGAGGHFGQYLSNKAIEFLGDKIQDRLGIIKAHLISSLYLINRKKDGVGYLGPSYFAIVKPSPRIIKIYVWSLKRNVLWHSLQV
jgi:hypothetical protein